MSEIFPSNVSLSTPYDAHPDRAQIEANTLAMARGLAGQTAPAAATMAHWAEQIEAGQIDCSAMIHLPRKSTPNHDEKIQLYRFLLKHGCWGANEIFPRVLNHVADMNLIASQWNSRLRETLWIHNSDYVAAYLQHPAVDVDKQIYDDGYTLLEECFRVLYDRADGRRITAQGNWCEQEAQKFADILLQHGAVMNADTVRMLRNRMVAGAPAKHLEVAVPYLQQWQQEWDIFAAQKNGQPIGRVPLGHFYSLGHLANVLHYEHWEGHEAEALHGYDQLPKWVKQREPCHGERLALAVRAVPQSRVAGWSIGVERAQAASVGR